MNSNINFLIIKKKKNFILLTFLFYNTPALKKTWITNVDHVTKPSRKNDVFCPHLKL